MGTVNCKSKQLFLSIEYKFEIIDGYGTQDEEGNWDGLVGELVNR